MKLNTHIKGKYLWKLCALAVLGIVIASCYVKIQKVDAPSTAKVGDVITIKLHDTISTNIDGGRNPELTNYVLCMLMPKGWNAGSSTVTSVTFTSQEFSGTGSMEPMPASLIEPSNSSHLNWPAACMAKFGLQGNLVSDVEWVVFRSTQQVTISNGDNFNPNPTIKIKVGADGNDTYFFPSYVICEAYDGLNDDVTWKSDPDWAIYNSGCMMVTGGSTGILNDYCNPQLTSVDPPKSADNEFITIHYNAALDTAHFLKGTSLYLSVDQYYVKGSDAPIASGKKVLLSSVSGNSKNFQVTLWPESFFGVTDDANKSVTKMVYHIVDNLGNTVGYGDDPSVPFSYNFVTWSCTAPK